MNDDNSSSGRPLVTQALLEVVDNQLAADDPPQTRKTLERLMSEGLSGDEAKSCIALVVLAEMNAMMRDRKSLDRERYVCNLRRLPEEPEA